MQQNYQTTKAPTAASSAAGGGKTPSSVPWSNPSRITADDGSSATWGAFETGQGASITGSTFGFNLPPGAVIDGVQVYIDGSNIGCYGDVTLSVPGTSGKAIGALSGNFGGPTDLWGATEITLADLASISVTADTNDVSSGDGFASMDYMAVTVFWHIDLAAAPTDVPTRIAHKVYSRDGEYLGNLPNPGPLSFTQDINSAGSTLEIICVADIKSTVAVEPLITGDEQEIITGNGLPILATEASTVIAKGNSTENALFKNSNRIKSYIYNYWYPNGKLIFSGQINRVGYKHGGSNAGVRILAYSDGADLANYIARGYPFAYTNDQSQTAQNGYVTVSQMGDKGAGWLRYGQTFVTGGSVTNVGAIALMLQGYADVTVSLFDGPLGNFIGSVTRTIANGAATVEQFEFAQLLTVPSGTQRFFAISVGSGQSINVYRNSTSVYANGEMYESSYGGGSGGGYYPVAGDLYFVTKYGTPTTTTTYTSDDPVTEMAAGILADYNARGGLITQRDFQATGLSLTYTFNMATIYDAIKKVLEMAPTGYYSYIDLGTAEIDILPTNETADFTVVKGRDINQLELALSIENVKNYLLFTGGEVSGSNLYRDYPDDESIQQYGIRLATKTDNRVIQTATADAIGSTFIEENSDETQETSLTVLNSAMDITLLTPGKTIGFRNFGYFIDSMVLQIVRREFSPNAVTLTLGRLPVTMSAEIQRMNRDLLNEQTAKNPSQPS